MIRDDDPYRHPQPVHHSDNARSKLPQRAIPPARSEQRPHRKEPPVSG
jgi:hypothetical protein